MSKHTFTSIVGESVFKVEIGWDRPMSCFYCLIDKDKLLEKEDRYFYSNLDDVFAQGELGYYEAVCKLYEIKLPDGLIKALLEDKKRNAVNERRNWDNLG